MMCLGGVFIAECMVNDVRQCEPSLSTEADCAGYAQLPASHTSPTQREQPKPAGAIRAQRVTPRSTALCHGHCLSNNQIKQHDLFRCLRLSLSLRLDFCC